MFKLRGQNQRICQWKWDPIDILTIYPNVDTCQYKVRSCIIVECLLTTKWSYTLKLYLAQIECFALLFNHFFSSTALIEDPKSYSRFCPQEFHQSKQRVSFSTLKGNLARHIFEDTHKGFNHCINIHQQPNQDLYIQE